MVFSMDGEGIFALIKYYIVDDQDYSNYNDDHFYIFPDFMPDFHIIYSPPTCLLFQDILKQLWKRRPKASIRQVGNPSFYSGNFQSVCVK